MGGIGLKHPLHKLGVPGFESRQCNCRTGPEIPRYVLLGCPYETERRYKLKEAQGDQNQLSYTWLLDTPKGALVARK